MQNRYIFTTAIITAALAHLPAAAQEDGAGASATPEATVEMPTRKIEQTGRNISTAYSQPGDRPGAMIGGNEVLATELLGEEVFASRAEGRQIAVIEDAILDSDGRLKGVIIAANEAYGVEGNRYVVPLQRLALDVASPDLRVSTDISQEELAGAPDYSAVPENMAEDAADELYESERAAEVARVTQNRELADGAQNIGAEIRAQAAIAEGDATNGAARETDGGVIAERSVAAGEEVETTGSITPADYGTPVEMEALTADALIDAPVMAGSGDVIGNTEDVLFTEEGTAEAVLLDVGGFLGIGETRVALPLENAEAVKGADGGYALFTSLTEEELREMKPYKSD